MPRSIKDFFKFNHEVTKVGEGVEVERALKAIANNLAALVERLEHIEKSLRNDK